ncbi:MAG: alanine--tRNA ligase [Anaerolineales bacterium]|nr:alanine--tRNA ligase [Anaerolineales bacterium]
MTKKPASRPAPHKWTGAEIRRSFLEFFSKHGHTIVPSASLVPGDDPTLLFTNSGMVQFKDVFLGTDTRPYTRVADAQKCMRVAGKHNDLEDVGRDDTHHTFFEMLGNWSFGDYYKKEAIAWAWQLLTDVWGLPRDRLWATCFEDERGIIPRDDEAADAWREQPGFDRSHLLYFGRKDNLWEMAEVGPCGPDSEIHIDRGAAYCTKQDVAGHVCRVNGDCPRFLELWNLVFIQYNRTGPTAADLSPLPKKHVDTGMGLERIVSVMQDVDSNYRTDLFTPILAAIQRLTGHSDAEREANLTPYRVIADHGRAAAFLVADGVVPGNTGRNYVCRMIIRRAARFGAKLGFDEPFLARVAETVVEQYGQDYAELAKHRDNILRTLTQEEQRFQRTVDIGLANLNALLGDLAASGEARLSGEEAFTLYATFGLPLEITRDVAQERGLMVDEAGFARAREAHAEASRTEVSSAGGGDVAIYRTILQDLQAQGALGPDGVEYDPYNAMEFEEPVLALVRNGQRVSGARPGDKLEVVLPRTCFYIASGGQVADTGAIAAFRPKSDEPLWEIQVEDVRRPAAGIVVHAGHVVRGSPKEGDLALAAVDADRRWDIMRNHTATHLLHSELRYVLGDHVRQAGSLVAPDRLRFDFTHQGMLTQEQLDKVARSVNEAVLANYPLRIEYMDRQAAVEAGAMALFGEKYGATVRTVRIGEPEPFSFELCGGTHVTETADIGPFVIVSEEAAAAGVRRIEAVTGRGALDLIQQRLGVLDNVATYLKASPADVDRRVLALLDEQQTAQKEIVRLRRELAQRELETLLGKVEQVRDVAVLAGAVKQADADTLREMTDWFRARVPSGVVVLGSVFQNRPHFVASVTEDLVKRGMDAGKIVKTVARVVGGGGGGKPNLAQAGGKDPSRLAEALAQVKPAVESALNAG